MQKTTLFCGTSHSQMGQQLARHLSLPLGRVDFTPFPDGELSLQIGESVRGSETFVIQTLARKPNDYLMELLIMVDALRRASAGSITAVIPYLGYARQDRKNHLRTPITGKLVANILVAAGVNRLLTMDLHAQQVEGFFDIPVDSLYAYPALCQKVLLKNPLVVAPDLGATRMAQAVASHLGTDFGVLDKQRDVQNRVEIARMIGPTLEGRAVLLVDDMCSTGATLVAAARFCAQKGAARIHAAFTHPLLTKGATALLEASPVEKFITTNTVPQGGLGEKWEMISVAPLFAEAIGRMLSAESVSSIFT